MPTDKRLFALTFTAALAGFGCSSGPIEVAPLATHQQGATALVANGAYLYWGVPSGEIRRVAADGGSQVETILSGIKPPTKLAVDDTNVYYVTFDGDVGAVTKTGGKATILSQLEDDSVGLSTDGQHVFWARSSGQVKRVKVTGGAVDQITDTAKPTALGLQGATLYFSTGKSTPEATTDEGTGAIQAAATDTAKTTTAADVTTKLWSPTNLSVATKKAFFVDLDNDALELDPTTPLRQLSTTSLEGGDASKLAGNFQNVNEVTADDDETFVAADDLDPTATVQPGTRQTATKGAIMSVASNGGTPQTVVRGPLGRVHLALDSATVYWVFESDGYIFGATRSAGTATTPQ